MKIELAPPLDALVRERVESGKYVDASAVIREALRLLEDKEKLDHLRASIAVAKAEVARGEVVDWSPSFLDELRREAAEASRNGIPVHDDVKP